MPLSASPIALPMRVKAWPRPPAGRASGVSVSTYPEIGYNFRLTDIQASIGVVQMTRLDDMLARRKRAAERYRERLDGHRWIVPPHVPDHVAPNWQSFQVRLKPGAPLSRNALMDALHARDIPTRRGVMASHHEAPYRDIVTNLPHTDAAAAQCLQLPMHAGLDAAQVDRVVDASDQALSVR
jgi:perosamine synthetase